MSQRPTHRLAAVMFSDVKGYTAMVQSDEAKALKKVGRYTSIVRELTAQYRGEINAFHGDGSSGIFPSAVDAVNCAIEIQHKLIADDIPVRIALHLGEIALQNEIAYGEGINITAQLEPAGISGSIVITDTIQRELENHPEIETTRLGQFEFDSGKSHLIYALVVDGVKIPPPLSTSESGSRKRVVLGAFVAVCVVLLTLGWYLWPNADSHDVTEDRIAVRFTTFTSSPKASQLAEMSAHWLSNRLQEIPGSRVVRYDDAMTDPNLQMSNLDDKTRTKFMNRTGATNLLEGQVFQAPNGDSLLFDARIIDLSTGQLIKQFSPTTCSTSDPIAGLNALGTRIMGWWASRDIAVLSVPTYEAYEAYMAAYRMPTTDDSLARVNATTAIQLDPEFVDPYILLLSLMSNADMYSEMDSLLRVIRSRFPAPSQRQNNIIGAYEAATRGDLTTYYRKSMSEIAYDSVYRFANTEAVVLSMTLVNDAPSSLQWYEMIPPDSLDLASCDYCYERFRTALRAYLQVGDTSSASETLQHLRDDWRRDIVRQIEYFVAVDDTVALNSLVTRARALEVPRSGELWGNVAWYYTLAKQPKRAKQFGAKALKGFRKDRASAAWLEAQYILSDYSYPADVIKGWIAANYALNPYVLNYSARIAAHTGDQELMTQVMDNLDIAEASDKYDFGYYTYIRAVVASILGNTAKANSLLASAYEQGHQFQAFNYHYDIDLIPLFESPEFEKIIHPTRP